MKYWITAANSDRNVVFNQLLEFDNLSKALAHAMANIAPENHQQIIITDADNNPIYPCEDGNKLHVYIGQWNKRKQCYPVRVTSGACNMQWLDDEQRAAVTVVYTYEFKSSAQAKAYAVMLGAEWYPGWD